MTSKVDAATVDPGERSGAEHASGVVLAIAASGLALSVALALSWYDHIPGGHRLRTMFEPLARRDRRAYLVHVAERLTRFRNENPAVADGSILFLGSSTIERMPLGTVFPEKACVNRGIASQSATDLLAQLDAELPRAQLGGIVLYTGGIDWRAGASLDELDHRVGGIFEHLALVYPKVATLFLGVIPERGMSATQVRELGSVNARLRELARAHGAAFLDVARAPIADSVGALAVEYSADSLHLNADGYRELCRWIIEDGGEVGRRLAP